MAPAIAPFSAPASSQQTRGSSRVHLAVSARVAGLSKGILPALVLLTLSATAQTPRPLDPNNMQLSEKWIPHNIHTRKEQVESLAFYSRKALAMTQGTPSTLWGHVTWLMPLSEALKGLPAGILKLKSVSVARPSFPDGLTFHAWRLPYLGVEDAGERFDQIIFVVDVAERVVSLQLTQEAPKKIDWGKGWDGERNPYYNFLYDRFNAQAGRNVRFKFTPAGSGVVRLKLVLPVGRESNHWFLPAPLAEKFILIEEAVRTGGQAIDLPTVSSRWKGRSNATDTNGFRDQASVKATITSVNVDTFVLNTESDSGSAWNWTFRQRDRDLELIKSQRLAVPKGVKNPQAPIGITGNGKIDEQGLQFHITWPMPNRRLTYSSTFELKMEP